MYALATVDIIKAGILSAVARPQSALADPETSAMIAAGVSPRSTPAASTCQDILYVSMR